MISITFISPYKELEQKIYSYLEEVADPRVAFEVVHIKGTKEEILKECCSDIVVARGITYLALKEKRKNVSVIEIAVTGYDIITALSECKKKYNSKKIAIIASESILYEMDSVQKIMDIEIEVYKIRDEKDIREALKSARNHKVDAIVGGLTACDMGEKMGWKCIRIQTGEEAVRRSINEAFNAANTTRLERAKAELLNVILENTKEPIVALNRQGIITAFNKAAYKALGIPLSSKVKGELVGDIIPDTDLFKDIEEGEEKIGVIGNINGKMVISDRVPIKVESRNVGLVCTFQNVDKIQEIESKIRKKLSSKGLVAKYRFTNIIGNSKALDKTIQTANKYSQVESNILLIGETGTGKELFAQSIHNASNRGLEPFVAVNCAALPENLLESELFGYVEGAFSGAVKGGKVGLFELAHRGTIFLDEISELPISLQAKLLRVLQEREVRRIGDDRLIPIDVRVVSASNINLKQKVKDGEFRQDLLYRLDVLNLKIPPLREREEDIIEIAEYYIRMYCKDTGKKIPKLTEGAKDALIRYSWPGNVRELRNICERFMVLAEDTYIREKDILELIDIYDNDASEEKESSLEANRDSDISAKDIDEVMKLMQLVKVNKEDMAKLLGISRTTLWRRLKQQK